jgi:hypothetical protein
MSQSVSLDDMALEGHPEQDHHPGTGWRHRLQQQQAT